MLVECCKFYFASRPVYCLLVWHHIFRFKKVCNYAQIDSAWSFT